MAFDDKYRMLDNKLIWHPDVLHKWRSGELFAPIHLDIGVTSRCNYRCVHCLYDYLDHKPRDLSHEMLLTLMKDIAAVGVRSIFFASQGEPLLNPSLPDAVVTASENGVDVALSSNGSRFGRDVAEQMLPHLKWVRVSVLAASRENYTRLHGTNEKTWASAFENLAAIAEIKHRRGLKTILGIQTCLLPESGPEILPLTEFARTHGFDYITFRPISQLPENTYHVTEDLLQKFGDELRRAEQMATSAVSVVVRWNLEESAKPYDHCLGLPFIAFVNADGGIYSCGCRLDEPAYCYGSLHEKRFADIWMHKARQEMTERLARHPEFDRCDLYCRHHALNKFMWQYAKEPPHVNFI